MDLVTEVPAPEEVPGCIECATFKRKLGEAAGDASAQADVRVRWRRHARTEHGQRFPGLRD